jgi:hypothetical protein
MTQHQPQQVPQRLPPPPAAQRIQAMIQVLLEHQQVICQHPTGSFEFHFHHDRVTARLIAHLSPPS